MIHLILTAALAKRWKQQLIPKQEAPFYHPALLWRADWFQVGGSRSNIICVNEATMFSFVLLRLGPMGFRRTMNAIANGVGDCLYEVGVPPERIKKSVCQAVLIKHVDRRVNGLLTNLKLDYEWYLLEPPPHIETLSDVHRFFNYEVLFFGKYPAEALKELLAEGRDPA